MCLMVNEIICEKICSLKPGNVTYISHSVKISQKMYFKNTHTMDAVKLGSYKIKPSDRWGELSNFNRSLNTCLLSSANFLAKISVSDFLFCFSSSSSFSVVWSRFSTSKSFDVSRRCSLSNVDDLLSRHARSDWNDGKRKWSTPNTNNIKILVL